MKREFEGIAAFDPEDPKNMEKVKGKSLTIPHQGVDVGLIMERANKGLPFSPIPSAFEEGSDEDFAGTPYEFYDFSDEFERVTSQIFDLQAYIQALKAKQAEQSESAAEAVKSGNNAEKSSLNDEV